MLSTYKILKAQSKNTTSKSQHSEKTIVSHYILTCFSGPFETQEYNHFKTTSNPVELLCSLLILLFIPQCLMSTYYMVSTMTGTR